MAGLVGARRNSDLRSERQPSGETSVNPDPSGTTAQACEAGSPGTSVPIVSVMVIAASDEIVRLVAPTIRPMAISGSIPPAGSGAGGGTSGTGAAGGAASGAATAGWPSGWGATSGGFARPQVRRAAAPTVISHRGKGAGSALRQPR